MSHWRPVALSWLLLTLAAPALPAPSSAAPEGPLYFEDAAAQARYEGLLAELRCLVCQNQSLSDSDAPLAKDLRRRVHDMVRQGASDTEIVDFLVTRYGDFVLYRPPLRRSTWLLWFAPALMLLIAAVVIVRLWRRRGGEPE